MTSKSLKEMSPELSADVSDEVWAEAVMEEVHRDATLVEFAGDWRFSLLWSDTVYEANARLAWEGLLTADSGEVMDRLPIDLRALLDREELLERESLADRRLAVKEEVGADFSRWLKRWKHKNDLEANIPLWAKQAGLEMGSNLKYRLWSVKERAGEDQLILQIRPYAIQGVELRVSTGSSGIWKDACKMWDGFYESSVVLTELGAWVVQEKEKRRVWELTC